MWKKGLCCLRMLCQGMSDVGNSDISWSDGSGGSGKMCWLRKVCKSVSGNGYFQFRRRQNEKELV